MRADPGEVWTQGPQRPGYTGAHILAQMVKKGSKAPTRVVRKEVVVTNATNKSKKKSRPQARASRAPVFGPVSTIDTAPVSIGNTVSGSAPIVTPIVGGQNVKGRDFFFSVDATAASITNWTLVGGAPFMPAAFVASTLRSFNNTYAEYCVHGIAVHFVTASPTNSSGNVMFYINKDRNGPLLPTSSPNFMSVVLSDNDTVIAPLWKNSSASYFPSPRWYKTDVFNSDDLEEQSCGEIFVYSKTTEIDVPGYILVDYDISFRQMQVNPKSGILPVSRAKYNQVLLTATSAPAQVAEFTMAAGVLLDGVTNSSTPSGFVVGEVYKVVFNTDDASLGGTSLTSFFKYNLPHVGAALYLNITLTDGFTAYAVYTETDNLVIYPSYAAALVATDALLFVQGSATVKFPAYLSLVGSVGTGLLQANI